MNVHQTLLESDFLFEPLLSVDGREMPPEESRFYLNKMVLGLSLELITLSVIYDVAPEALCNANLLVKNMVGEEADKLINYCRVLAELMTIEYKQEG